jgi:hypothetical protein
MSSMKERGSVKGALTGLGWFDGRSPAAASAGSEGSVIHPVALGGPVCRAVLGGSNKTAAVL